MYMGAKVGLGAGGLGGRMSGEGNRSEYIYYIDEKKCVLGL